MKTHWSFFLPLLPDNRASLLRPGTAPKKPLNEKDISMHLWKNYIIFACRVVPPNPSPIIRCVSPDLMLSSSPESLSMITDRSADNKSPSPLIQPSVSELSIFFFVKSILLSINSFGLFCTYFFLFPQLYKWYLDSSFFTQYDHLL